MKHLFLWIFLALLAVIGTASAQWIPTDGPFGNPVSIIASSGNRIFALNGAALSVSFDSGRTWISLGSPAPDKYIRAFAVNRDTLFAGTDSGVFRSVDGGGTWAAINNGIISLNVLSLGITNGFVFVGTDSGLFRLATKANSWTKCTVPFFFPSQKYISTIEAFDSVIMASSLDLWRSTDLGATWAVDTGIMNTGVSPSGFAHQGSTLYAELNDFGLKRSTDNGLSWSNASNGLSLPQYYGMTFEISFAAVDSDIFIGTDSHGVFRSTDKGDHWQPINTGLLDTNILSLTALGNKLLACTEFGTFFSRDHGDSWTLYDSISPKRLVNTVISHNGTIFAGARSGVFRSDNSGSSWIFTGLLNSNIRAFAIKGDTLFAGGYGIYRSVTGGNTWENTGYILPTNYFATALYVKGNYLYAGLSSQNNSYRAGIYRSSNDGNTWDWEITGFTDSSISVFSFASIGNTLFAGTDHGVYVSTNDGDSWSLPNSGLSDTIYALLSTHDSLFAGSASNGVFFSDDNGSTWAKINSNLTNQNIRAFFNSDYIATGTEGGGVFLTSGNGNGWKEFNNGLTNADNKSIYGFSVSGSEMFAATGDGVWKLSLQGVDAVPMEQPALNDYAHPNPFSLFTTISFDLPSSANVSLRIVDALGKEVCALLSGENLTAGTHEVRWNANEFPNGVYFYHLTTDSFSETEKIILLR